MTQYRSLMSTAQLLCVSYSGLNSTSICYSSNLWGYDWAVREIIKRIDLPCRGSAVSVQIFDGNLKEIRR